MSSKCVMISAGETSGDSHGAHLVRAMKSIDPSLFFLGIGGDNLYKAGVKIIVHSSTISVVGITEVFSKAGAILSGLKKARAVLKSIKPDLLILIDFPDFNFCLASHAKKLGIPVLYYISPQIWAWRSGRVKKIKKIVDRMAVILPFEEDFYKKYNIRTTYVGHPLIDSFDPEVKNMPDSGTVPIIGLVPGSRDSEIAKHLPVMLKSAEILKDRVKKIRFALSIAPGISSKNINIDNSLVTIMPLKKILRESLFIIAASGTVTLEIAMAGAPMVIIYKISRVSYRLGKMLIKVKNIGLVNLIAGKQIVTELIQDNASPEKIAETVHSIIQDRGSIEKIKEELSVVKKILGGPGASKRVANIAIDML